MEKLDENSEYLEEDVKETESLMSEQDIREFNGILNPKGRNAEEKINFLEIQADHWRQKALLEVNEKKEKWYKDAERLTRMKADRLQIDNVIRPMSRVNKLYPGYKKSKMSNIKGNRVRHTVTLNPNSANSEDLYIDIPKLNPSLCLVPDSLRMLFNFKNSNTKSWFLNNLSKLLKSRLVIKFAGEIVYDNTGESILEVYKDLWKPEYERADMIQYGIGTENVRKLISKDDSGASSGTTQCLKLEKILSTHGLYAPYGMINNFQYTGCP